MLPRICIRGCVCWSAMQTILWQNPRILYLKSSTNLFIHSSFMHSFHHSFMNNVHSKRTHRWSTCISSSSLWPPRHPDQSRGLSSIFFIRFVNNVFSRLKDEPKFPGFLVKKFYFCSSVRNSAWNANRGNADLQCSASCAWLNDIRICYVDDDDDDYGDD